MSATRTQNLYGYPDMGRTGLAHSLLAWGRCAVWCRDTGATMMAPRWLRPRIGPYLRNERDKRNYFLTFQPGKLLSEPYRSIVRLRAQTLYAELDLPEAGYAPHKPTVVVFRNAQALNEKKMFHLVTEHGPFLKQQLLAITRPQYVPDAVAKPHIAIHVRLGDFSVASESEIKAGATNSRLSIAWYGLVLDKLRIGLAANAPAVVYSDGSDAELALLLARPNVSRAPRNAAITDLLSLSQSSVLIASASGFSLWGAFLGEVPCISYNGQSFENYLPKTTRNVEADGAVDLPEDFLQLAATRLGFVQS